MINKLNEERREFFSSCHYLAKAPGSFFWSGEHSVMYGQLAIIQSIPLYLYVGIQQGDFGNFAYDIRYIKKNTSTGLIQIDNSDFESISLGAWEDKYKVEEFLKYWKNKTGLEYFKLKIWSEIPPKCGLNSSGAFGASLSALLYMMENKLNCREFKETVEKWKNISVEDLRKNQSFLSIFKTAWALDDCFHDYSSSGAGPFSSLLGSPNEDLILYFTQKKGFGSQHPIRRIAKEKKVLDFNLYEPYLDKIDRLAIFGKKIDIPFWIREKLAVSLIYSGEAKDTGWVLEELRKWFTNPVREFAEIFYQHFDKKEIKNYEKNLSRPISDFIEEHDEYLAENEFYSKTLFTESLGLLSWALLKSLKNERMDVFQERIRDIHNFLNFYKVFKGKLIECYRSINDIDGSVAIKLTGAGGGGDLVVFGNRDVIEGVEKEIEGKGEYQIHYSSNYMGWAAEPISIIIGSKTKPERIPEKEKEEKEYDVYIDGEFKPMTRNEVKDLESHKKDYLAWVWVDDERSEIIIGKEERDIKPDSIAFKFLREILKSVGKDLLHETIYKEMPEINKEYIHQNLNKLKKKTGHVLEDYIKGRKRFRYSIGKFKSCLIMKK
jgi:mevalonate kinase